MGEKVFKFIEIGNLGELLLFIIIVMQSAAKNTKDSIHRYLNNLGVHHYSPHINENINTKLTLKIAHSSLTAIEQVARRRML